MVSRRLFSIAAIALAGGLLMTGSGRAAGGPEPVVADNGLYTQPWFLDSFLELSDDLAEAAAQGKHFAVIFEQRGCPYCRELHRVNFAKEEIKQYIAENYVFLQIDLWGSRKVTDFDGEALEERELARKWGVLFTPTIAFFPDDPQAVKGKSGKEAEVVRMPGYFKPFHFISMLEYVHREKYEETGFQRFLQARFEELKAKGIEPEVW